MHKPHSIGEQRSITGGRIVPVGAGFVRRAPKRVDYLLRYTRDFPLAVVEGKAAIVMRPIAYSRRNNMQKCCGLKFAYATNGKEILEFGYAAGRELRLSDFSSPADL